MRSAAFPLDEDDGGAAAAGEGYEYLARVMKESRSLPKVTVAHVVDPPRPQTVFVDRSLAVVGRLQLLDGNESAWVDAFAARYAALRAAAPKQMRALAPGAAPPSMKDRSYWRNFVRNNDPAASVLARMDAVAVTLFVENMAAWLLHDRAPVPLTERLCCWLFAVGTLLKEPLDPVTCSDLQAIARFLNGLKSDDEQLAACARVTLVAISKSLPSISYW